MNFQKAAELVAIIRQTGIYEGDPDDSEALRIALGLLEPAARLETQYQRLIAPDFVEVKKLWNDV